MKIFSFIGGMITSGIIMLFFYIFIFMSHTTVIENKNKIIESLGDAADFAAYYHDSGDETAMDSCLSKRKQAYDLGYRGWY